MGGYRKIAPSIMKKSSAESDTTSKLYDVRENIKLLRIKAVIENKNQFIEEIKKIIWKFLNIFLNL